MELLSVSNLNLSVGTEAKILNSSFTVESGDVLLLTGPNGCGKSTIIKLIMGATFDYKDIECSDGTILYKSVHDILHDEKENGEHTKEKIDYFVAIDTRCPEHNSINSLNLFCFDEKGK